MAGMYQLVRLVVCIILTIKVGGDRVTIGRSRSLNMEGRDLLKCGPRKKRHAPLTTSSPPDITITTTAASSTATTTTTTTKTTTTTTPPLNAVTTFCVVADAPYRSEENRKLLNQVENMSSECEFVAHLGDIRSARKYDTCVRETYRNASIIMQRSEKPVLMVLGGKCQVGSVVSSQSGASQHHLSFFHRQ